LFLPGAPRAVRRAAYDQAAKLRAPHTSLNGESLLKTVPFESLGIQGAQGQRICCYNSLSARRLNSRRADLGPPVRFPVAKARGATQAVAGPSRLLFFSPCPAGGLGHLGPATGEFLRPDGLPVPFVALAALFDIFQAIPIHRAEADKTEAFYPEMHSGVF